MGIDNSLLQVDSDTYALAYSGALNDGYISTFTIDSDGNITAVKTQSEGNNLEHDTDRGSHNSLVQVDSDTYALAYQGTDLDGFISTFTIDSDGNITAVKTQSEGNNLEHDTSDGHHNSLVQVDSDTYALAYSGTGYDGFISTFTISSDGTTITEVDTLEHDTGRGIHNSLVQVDSGTYALAYKDDNPGGDGLISTFTIDSDGNITALRTQSEGNNLEHDTVGVQYNSLVKVDSDTYALAYDGAGNDGFISTFTIVTALPDKVGTVSTSSSANLSWTAPTAGVSAITDYVIQYSTDDSTWSTFDDGTSTDTTTTVTCLTKDTTYYFQVAAVNSSGTGDFSSSSSVLVTVDECTTTDSTSTGGGGGGSQSCNSRGFGVGKSLAVYEVSYNFCGDNSSIDILAYSTCGSISAQLTTEYGRSTAGLSLDQPFIDDEITVYTGILRDDIKKFTVKMENKRNSFEDTFVINECKTTKRYSQTTGYTSSQQGTFGNNGITISVPQWVKNTAGWWAEDKISEDEFVKGIEFLVKERIIDNVKTGNVEPASSAVPTWVKNNAEWWAEGQIDDNSFVKGIEYLVKVGLIQVT